MRTSTLEKKGYDIDFICNTQPVSNLKFFETAYRSGGFWHTCLHVFKLKPDPDIFWLDVFGTFNDAVVMTDKATRDQEAALKKIQSVSNEQYNRMLNERNTSDKMIAKEEYLDANALGTMVKRHGEVIKHMHIRLYISAKTQVELEKRVLEVRKKLKNNDFGADVFSMEMEEEYQSLFLEYSGQQFLSNKRTGIPVPCNVIGDAFPANYVRLHDPRGGYLGRTNTGGNVFFDAFHVDGKHRNFYNFMILGQTSYGKSTLLKLIMSDEASKGYMIRGFDKSGEFTKLVKLLGGKIVRLDGRDGMINNFEIFETILNEETGEVDEYGCFMQHKSKMSAWYKIVKQSKLVAGETDEFSILVHDFYTYHGFVDQFGNISRITTRKATEYPTLSQFIDFVSGIKATCQDEDKNKRLNSILLTLQNLRTNYGRLLDGHTTFNDLDKEQILFFNIDGLSSMDSNIVTAQLFNAINLFWGTMFKHGKEQKRLYESGEISFDMVKRSRLIVDEFHNVFNPQQPELVKYGSDMEREGRKIFLGLGLASQSIRAMIPTGSDTEVKNTLKTMYEFIQYHFFFHFASDALNDLRTLSEGQLNEKDIKRIGSFPQGRCILCVNGAENYEISVDASKEMLTLFDGGGKKVS